MIRSILIVPGSRRRQSWNRKLAECLASTVSREIAVEVLAPETVDLPLFDQDLERDADLVEKAAGLHERFLKSDGLIVVGPEYNGSFSPYLKNTVDWVSRIPRIPSQNGKANPFRDKPLLLGCATTGRDGGRSGLLAMRNLFAYLGALILPDQISLPHAEQAWDEAGEFQDPFYADHLDQIIHRFLRLVAQVSETPA